MRRAHAIDYSICVEPPSHDMMASTMYFRLCIAFMLGGAAVVPGCVAKGAPPSGHALAPPEISSAERRPATGPPKLEAEPTDAARSFWPTHVCTNGPGSLVLENTCRCDEAPVCSVERRGNVLDLRVRTRERPCKDCGKVTIDCALPESVRSGDGVFRVTIGGSPALEQVEIRNGGRPVLDPCAP